MVNMVSTNIDKFVATDVLSGLLVVARQHEIDRLRQSTLMHGLDQAAFLSLEPDEPIPGHIMRGAALAVIEVDTQSSGSLARMREVRSAYPELSVIAAIERADVSLVRTLLRDGIADVAQLPLDAGELMELVVETTATRAGVAGSLGQAPMSSIIRSTGGCGATTIVTHLAAAMARRLERPSEVCVVDLDIQSGDVASFVGALPKVNLANLLDSESAVDSALVRNAVAKTSYGFSLLAAPDEISPLSSVQVEAILQILRTMRETFGRIFIDLPSDWTDWALSTAIASDEIILVTDLSISSLRQAKRRIDLLEKVGADKDRIRVVVNRVEKRLFRTIGVEEVEDALDIQVISALPDEKSNLRSAQDQGVLIGDHVGSSKYEKAIASLADQLIAPKE